VKKTLPEESKELGRGWIKCIKQDLDHNQKFYVTSRCCV